jgi:alkanesulfonate monooxygenase SsuD/methylene tetrahydromethanopterin reductase-like flavin-dependent oxidoreductase (luciferase family)
MAEVAPTPRDTHPWVAEAAKRVRFGVSIFPQPVEWSEFIGCVQAMEAGGIDSYWSYDHPQSRADCWTALAALAATTKSIRLGTLVDCIYYRSPYLLARQAADVDRLSGGRLVLGVGIGDNVPEFEQMGIPFPPVKDRLEAMVETIEIVRGLWSDPHFAFAGKHFSAKSDGKFLGPVQQPRVPILLAGGGERVTLKQVARYADASNMGAHDWIGSAVTTGDIQRKFGKLREYCDALGRPYESVLRSHFAMPLVMAETEAELERKLSTLPKATLDWCGDALFAGTPAKTIAFYRELTAIGFQYFIANILDGDLSTIDLMCKYLVPGTVDGTFRA